MKPIDSQGKAMSRRTLYWMIFLIILQFGLFFLIKIAGVQTEVFVYQLF